MWPFRSRVAVKSDDPEELLRHWIIVLNGDICDELATPTIAKLLFLNYDDPKSPITLRITSLGGTVSAGMAIIDTIRTLRTSVQTEVPSYAHGIALAVFAAGEKGERVLGFQATCSMGDVRDCNKSIEDVRGVRQRMIDMFAELTGQIQEYVNQQMLLERSFNASDEISFGFADRIAVNAGEA